LRSSPTKRLVSGGSNGQELDDLTDRGTVDAVAGLAAQMAAGAEAKNLPFFAWSLLGQGTLVTQRYEYRSLYLSS
jgi:hypothetical protein